MPSHPIHSAQHNSFEMLVSALKCLPGVGPKSAQRMAYQLLQHNRKGAAQLGAALTQAVSNIQHCVRCNTFTETETCSACLSEKRDATQLCVVETPADQNAIEQTASYQGFYFVLMGRISPLDGIGPKEVNVDRLLTRACDGVVQEVILATNFTNEGEATAHYLSELLGARGLRVSRLARGVPVGGELEYVDAGTVARALQDRRVI